MKILENFKTFLSFNKSYGIGVLDDNVSDLRGGFSKAVMEERRKSSRVDVNVPVWFRIKKSWGRWLLGKGIEHSTTGIRLALPPGVKPGTELNLRMKLPDAKKPINIQGIVLWVNDPAGVRGASNNRNTVECGIAFQDLRNVKHKEKLVYLIANKLCKLGLSFTRNLVTRPTQTIQDLQECYSLVYRGYVARRYCLPNDKRMHYHYYSFLPESRTFSLREKDKLLGTISLIVDSPCGIPMDSLFNREIDHLRRKGRKLAEVSLLAMAPDEKKQKIFSLTNLDKQIRLFRLFKIMYEYAANYAGVTDLVIGVHPKHETLYKYLTFKAMGSPKNYAGARGNPALPMHLDLTWARNNYSPSLLNFFLADPATPEVLGSGIKFNTEIVKKFLCEDLNIWPEIPQESQQHLKKCYPGVAPSLFNSFPTFFKN